MSATRMAKRHPKLKAEDLPTTRADVIQFAKFISKDETFCLAVWDTLRTIEYREEQLKKERALLAEVKRRDALPKWRKVLHRLRLAL